jgi:heme/copper-type cytochrome/quinol oxidase subunit 4
VGIGIRLAVGHRRGKTHERRRRRVVKARQHRDLVRRALQLPHTQPAKRRDAKQGEQNREHAGAAQTHHVGVTPRCNGILALSLAAGSMSFATIFKAVLVIVFLAVIFELSRALYFMMMDRTDDNRTVWALTRRVAFSALLIILIIVGIATGVLQPHGVVVR